MKGATIVRVERCAYCDATGGPFHQDHVVPRSRGGPDSPANLVLACRSCNLEKSDRLPSEWLPAVPAHVAAIEERISVTVAGGIRAKRDSAKRWRERQTKARSERDPAPANIPGASLLRNRWPVCLEHDRCPCRLPADWEVSLLTADGWGAHCGKCVRFYSKKYTRELTEPRRTMHVLAQLRDGTLDAGSETTLLLIARAGGISVEEYCDIASRILCVDATTRAGLIAAFPLLQLGLWVPWQVSP